MSSFEFEGHRVFFRREGAGDAIVFLPNATLTGRLWEHQMEYFRDTHDVIAVDLPGFGQSDFVRPTLALFVRWLERFVEELELAPVTLVGNCIGSLTAVRYAAEHPNDVSALVLINMLDRNVGTAPPLSRGQSLLKVRALRPAMEWGFRHMPRRLQVDYPYTNCQFGDVKDARHHEYVDHARSCFARPETRVAFLSLGYDVDNAVLPPADQIAGLPPLCWVWGEANRLLPYDIGKRQLEVLEPDEVHVLKGRGYAAAWEAPAEVNRIIEAFLARHPAKARSDRRADIEVHALS